MLFYDQMYIFIRQSKSIWADLQRDQTRFVSLRENWSEIFCITENTFYQCAGQFLLPSKFNEHRVSLVPMGISLVMTLVLQKDYLNFLCYRTLNDKVELNSFGFQVPSS